MRALFVTHLHADHVMDLANLLPRELAAPVLDVYGPAPAGLPIRRSRRRRRPLVFPDEPTPGIRAAVDHLLRAFAYNINLRIADEGRIDVAESVRVHEIGVGATATRPTSTSAAATAAARRRPRRRWSRS